MAVYLNALRALSLLVSHYSNALPGLLGASGATLATVHRWPETGTAGCRIQGQQKRKRTKRIIQIATLTLPFIILVSHP